MLPSEIPVPPEGYERPPLPPGIIKATRYLLDHFPELLKKHYRKWVACDATGVLFVGDSQEVLYKKCLKRGLQPDEFVVDYMLPGALDDLHLPAYQDPT